jgi:hypothetical protein
MWCCTGMDDDVSLHLKIEFLMPCSTKRSTPLPTSQTKRPLTAASLLYGGCSACPLILPARMLLILSSLHLLVLVIFTLCAGIDSPSPAAAKNKKEPRIIGGTPLTPDELYNRYPYAASLQWAGHRCGGTLVAMDLAITAAHCVYMRSVFI